MPSGTCRNLLKDARRLRKNISTFQMIPTASSKAPTAPTTTTPFKQPLCCSEGSNVLDDPPTTASSRTSPTSSLTFCRILNNRKFPGTPIASLRPLLTFTVFPTAPTVLSRSHKTFPKAPSKASTASYPILARLPIPPCGPENILPGQKPMRAPEKLELKTPTLPSRSPLTPLEVEQYIFLHLRPLNCS